MVPARRNHGGQGLEMARGRCGWQSVLLLVFSPGEPSEFLTLTEATVPVKLKARGKSCELPMQQDKGCPYSSPKRKAESLHIQGVPPPLCLRGKVLLPHPLMTGHCSDQPRLTPPEFSCPL